MPQGLGRGLGSLIPRKISSDYSDFTVKEDGGVVPGAQRIYLVSPKEIVPNPQQPRHEFTDAGIEDLAQSIKEHGIIQPLVVTKTAGGYELIAGERRLRAANSLHLSAVPVIVREATNQKKLELALIENLQREALNPIETAIAYNQLANEFNLNQEEIARQVGKSRSGIANVIRLLNLPAEIQQALVDKRITEAHAKYLLGLDSPIQQMSVFRKILINNLSVKETDKMIKQAGGTKAAKVHLGYHDQAKEEKLRNFFGTKVELRRMKAGGQIIVNFYSDDELEEIVRKL